MHMVRPIKIRLSPQIERERKRRIAAFGFDAHWPRRMADFLEAGDASGFGFVGVDWEGIVAATAGMRDVVSAAAD